jgi:hypothetical protein
MVRKVLNRRLGWDKVRSPFSPAECAPEVVNETGGAQ